MGVEATRKKRIVPLLQSSEVMTIMPLGAGNEVGRSCIILEFKGKTIMVEPNLTLEWLQFKLDCGIHPAYTGLSALPFFDEIDPASVDLVLVTHFHLDHAASLPYFMEKACIRSYLRYSLSDGMTEFKGKVFMTHPTKAIYKWLLSDFIKVSNVSSEEMLYTEQDLYRSYDRIQAVDYHQEVEVDGIKFTCYNAGHVLGAAMFLVEIAGVKVLYTGDYSREEDRHLKAAEKPDTKMDVLICESTYGVQCHQSRIEREFRFTSLVHEIVTRDGRCLIPVFALGRAQELLLILDEYWQSHPELHKIPIYYASSLAKKCMAVYQTYVNMMNERIRKQITVSNPFVFKHISNLKSMDHFDDVGPCVMMASPGMLQNGLSRELFELWCSDKRNGVIIPGYCVEGTLAKVIFGSNPQHILSDPTEITSLSGGKLPLRMSVAYISFSAHVDFLQNSQFIDEVKAPNVVLVHGDGNEMGRLKNALQHKYEELADKLTIFTPKNCEKVELEFRGEKMAKVHQTAKYQIIGGAASELQLKDGERAGGILVGKDFEYQIMAPSDLSEYTHLTQVTVLQRQIVKCTAPCSLIEHHVLQLFGPKQVVCEKNTLFVYDVIQVEVLEDKVSIEWPGNFVNDMVVDSIMALLLHIESSRASVKLTSGKSKCHGKHGTVEQIDHIKSYLLANYGDVNGSLGDGFYEFTVNGDRVILDAESFQVRCDNSETIKMVSKAVFNLLQSVTPDLIL